MVKSLVISPFISSIKSDTFTSDKKEVVKSSFNVTLIIAFLIFSASSFSSRDNLYEGIII